MDNFNQTLESSIDELMKDQDALAIRNKTLAEAIHKTPFRHHIRRLFLQILSHTYIPSSRTANATDRILLIRPDHLGDLLLTTPAIQALREAYPTTEIHALVGPWSAGVLENYDLLDLVLTIPFPGFTRTTKKNLQSPYQYAVQTARRLRRIGYAHAIIFRPDHWWGAWTARLTGIPNRIGYDHPDTSLFLTQSTPIQHEHVVEQSLHLISLLTKSPMDKANVSLNFPIKKLDQAYVQGYLQEWDITDEDRVFCVHAGSGTGVKQWSAEKWAKVADILSEQLNAYPVFTGSDQELSLIQEIKGHMQSPAVLMAGDTHVNHLAAIFQRAIVVLGPDSGPLHIAVAVGTPSVTLFGPADPSEFGPWGNPQKHRIITSEIDCRPCRVLDWSHDNLKYHPCVRNITIAAVLHAARTAVHFNDKTS